MLALRHLRVPVVPDLLRPRTVIASGIRLLPTTTLRLRGNSRRRGQCGIQEAGHRLDHVLGARDGESRESVQLAFNLRGRLASNIYKHPELGGQTLASAPLGSRINPRATTREPARARSSLRA